jgi:hypothetical protein
MLKVILIILVIMQAVSWGLIARDSLPSLPTLPFKVVCSVAAVETGETAKVPTEEGAK